MVVAAMVAAALSGLLALAVVGKAMDRDGWRALARRAGGTPARGAALAIVVPLVELATAVLLIVRPAAGLALAAVVFAALAGGAHALRAYSEGTPCGCFGPLLETRIGLALVRRNLVLAALAAALAPVAAASGTRSSVASVAAGAVLAGAGLLAARVIAERPRHGPRVGSRPKGAPSQGRRHAVLFLAPGCPPCDRLAPQVETIARAAGVEIAVVLAGADAEAPLIERWRVPGTPFAVQLAADGRVVARGPVPDADALQALLTGTPTATPRPDEPATSRRAVLAAAGAAAAVVVVEGLRPSAATARAVARTAARPPVRRLAAGTRVMYDRNVNNRVRDTCDKMIDRLDTGGGVVGWDGANQGQGVGGYTWAEGLETGSSPAAAACNVRERKQETWKGYCPCPTRRDYTDESRCNVECPQGLKCFGVQCQTLERRVCVDLVYDVCLSIPLIVISVLEWTPPAGSSRGCRRMATAYNAGVKRHEEHHAADIQRVLKEVNNDFKNLSAKGCGDTLEAARAEANIAVNNSIQRAKDELKRRDEAATIAFHASPAGANGLIDCRNC